MINKHYKWNDNTNDQITLNPKWDNYPLMLVITSMENKKRRSKTQTQVFSVIREALTIRPNKFSGYIMIFIILIILLLI